MQQFNVGILGATGAVGQKFIRLLQSHSWFTIKALGASKRSSGKKYWEAAHWIEDLPLPEYVADMEVRDCDPKQFSDVDFVFSGLDSSVALEIEKAFAEAGIPVISNAKNWRMDETVPLLVPEVNPDHISLIRSQQFDPEGRGWIVTNPNCVCVPFVMAARPLYDAFGIDAAVVTSMQAVSGGGYPGVPSMDIIGNVVPYIGGEEPKIHTEPLKLLGRLTESNTIDHAKFPIQATATRVPTVEGHVLSITLKLGNPPQSVDELKQAINGWKNPIGELELPSSPKEAMKLYEDDRFPQPRLHASGEGGMQLGIGRLRASRVFDVSFVALAHNTIRGAAGGAILNAELLVQKGYLSS